MTTRLPSSHAFRTALSLCAAAAAVLICLYQHHFTVNPLHPSTFLLAARHRCGQLLLAALTWAVIETVNLTSNPTARPATQS